jgi:hypothetical protein
MTIPDGAVRVVEPGPIETGAKVLGYATGPGAWEIARIASKTINETGQHPGFLEGYTPITDPSMRVLPGHPVEHGAGYDCCCGACLALPARKAEAMAAAQEGC